MYWKIIGLDYILQNQRFSFIGKILSFACILPHSRTNYFEKVGKTWGFAGQQNHRKILYLEHGKKVSF